MRMLADVRGDRPNESAAPRAVAQKPGIGSHETLRNWRKRDEVDSGRRPGTTTEESAQVKATEREIAELKPLIRQILKSNYFVLRVPSRITNASVRMASPRSGRGEGGQNVDDLAYVAMDGRYAHAEPGGELSTDISAPQVCQGEQSMSVCGQAPPARFDLPPPGKRRVDMHAKLQMGRGRSWS